jgi:hypothetical protein
MEMDRLEQLQIWPSGRENSNSKLLTNNTVRGLGFSHGL